MTSETQSMSVPNAASKTLSRKYSPPNQSGKIANATRSEASIQPEIFLAEFIFKGSHSESNPAGRLRFESAQSLIRPMETFLESVSEGEE
jgi:hypothetical protein